MVLDLHSLQVHCSRSSKPLFQSAYLCAFTFGSPYNLINHSSLCAQSEITHKYKYFRLFNFIGTYSDIILSQLNSLAPVKVGRGLGLVGRDPDRASGGVQEPGVMTRITNQLGAMGILPWLSTLCIPPSFIIPPCFIIVLRVFIDRFVSLFLKLLLTRHPEMNEVTK